MVSYKDCDRNIKGYVELICGEQRADCSVSLMVGNDIVEPLGQSVDELYSNARVINSYAILANNYTKLDGTFCLFNGESGCIYPEIPSRYQNNIKVNIVGNDIDRVTIYTKNNNIRKFKACLYTDRIVKEKILKENDKEFININFKETGDKIVIEILEWDNSSFPAIISHVDIGITSLFLDNNLLEFHIIEQCDILATEIPANELNLRIGDHEENFNVLNENGITKYLNNETRIIPYIGILGDNGVKYKKQNIFYLDSWNYENKEVSIMGYNIFNKFKSLTLTNKTNTFRTQSVLTPSKFKTYLEEEYPEYRFMVELYEETKPIGLWNGFVNSSEFFDYLKNVIFGLARIIYEDKENDNIYIKYVDGKISDVLTNNELCSIPKVEIVEEINTLNVKNFDVKYQGINGNTRTDTIKKLVYVQQKEVEYFTIVDKTINMEAIDNRLTTFSGASDVEVLYRNNDSGTNDSANIVFVKVVAPVGADVEVNLRGQVGVDGELNKISFEPYDRKIYKGNPQQENILEVENEIFVSQFGISGADRILEKTYSKKYSFNYNGNPLIKAGENIRLDLKYGSHKIFVQRHELIFNGGLSGYIEGVE